MALESRPDLMQVVASTPAGDRVTAENPAVPGSSLRSCRYPAAARVGAWAWVAHRAARIERGRADRRFQAAQRRDNARTASLERKPTASTARLLHDMVAA
jgi:hypothetical protein